MNWTVTIIVTVILLLVPVALYASFAAHKDTHQYAEHYGPCGYSQEVQEPEMEGTAKQALHYEADSSVVDPPVTEWPTHL